MHAIEGLKELHSLNWLEQHAATLSAEKAKQKAARLQIAELRRLLPVSLLGYHERQAREKKPSVVRVSGRSCGVCGLTLSAELEHELRASGRFVLCPHCGVFVAMDPSPAQEAEVLASGGAAS